jgi:hypothetical protein
VNQQVLAAATPRSIGRKRKLNICCGKTRKGRRLLRPIQKCIGSCHLLLLMIFILLGTSSD